MGSTKARLGLHQEINAVDEGEYYSSWQIPVMHLALTIPGVDSRAKLSKLLRLPWSGFRRLSRSSSAAAWSANERNRLKVEKAPAFMVIPIRPPLGGT